MISVTKQYVVQLVCAYFITLMIFGDKDLGKEIAQKTTTLGGVIMKFAGYHSSIIIYSVGVMTNFVAAQKLYTLRPTWLMCIGTIVFVAFQVAFLFFDGSYLNILSAVVGFVASIVWKNPGSYLSKHFTRDTILQRVKLFWKVHEFCVIVGGILILAELLVIDSYSNMSRFSFKITYLAFAAWSIASPYLTEILNKSKNVQEMIEDSTSISKLLLTKNMMLLSILFAHIGIAQSFWAVGLIFGIFGEKMRILGHDFLILLGTCFSLLACVVMGYGYSSIHIYLMCAVALVFADVCWTTQLMTFINEKYTDRSEQVLSNFRMTTGLLSCFIFILASLVSFYWLLAVLCVSSILATVCLFLAEQNREVPSKVTKVE